MEWLAALKSLSAQSLSPVYVLVGTEPILAQRFIQCVTQTVSPGGDGLIRRCRFDETGCDEALTACESVSLFGADEVVVLDHCLAMTSATKQKYDVTRLEAYLQSPVPNRVLVITVYVDKLDERKKLTKLAKSWPTISTATPKDDVALRILSAFAAELDAHIDSDAQKELWRRCSSVSLAVTELQKLLAYCGGGQIRFEDVTEVVSPPLDDNVFNWIDGVVTGNAHRAFGALSDVERGGYDPFGLLAMIARQLRLMWYARWLGEQGHSEQQIATRAGAHPYAVKVAATQARRVSAQRIEHLLTAVADAEHAIKTGRREPQQALEWIVMNCLLA